MKPFMRQARRGGVVFCAAILLAGAAHAAEPEFVPSTELLAAAKKEGRIVLYTANFLDTEQAVVKRFSQRFPGIQIEIVRGPTGQLITRIKTEAAANKMIADVIDISDRAQARAMNDLFAPYTPPNAADYAVFARTGDRLAALRQRLDDRVQRGAREGSAEVLGRPDEAGIRQDASRTDRRRRGRRTV
jgi:ABC-type glycerol-3-phosphate transport system substrate-binding protein